MTTRQPGAPSRGAPPRQYLPEDVGEALDAFDTALDLLIPEDANTNSQVYHEALPYLQKVRRVLRARQQVPAGWKLVPVEPTDEMLLAGIPEPLRTLTLDHANRDEVLGYERESYQSCIAAAPTPPAASAVHPEIRALIPKWREAVHGCCGCADELESTIARIEGKEG